MIRHRKLESPTMPPRQLQPQVGDQGRDPLDLLKLDDMIQFLNGKSGPLVLEVGDTWLVKDGSNWIIGADEPATEDDVRELLISAGGVATILDFQ